MKKPLQRVEDIVERWVCENHPGIGWAGECCDPSGWNDNGRCPHGLCGCGAGHGVERTDDGERDR